MFYFPNNCLSCSWKWVKAGDYLHLKIWTYEKWEYFLQNKLKCNLMSHACSLTTAKKSSDTTPMTLLLSADNTSKTYSLKEVTSNKQLKNKKKNKKSNNPNSWSTLNIKQDSKSQLEVQLEKLNQKIIKSYALESSKKNQSLIKKNIRKW